MMRYIFGILSIFVVAIAAIVLVVNREPAGNRQAGERQVALTDYVDSGATATYTVYGEITGEEDFNGIRISVSRNRRTIEVLNGYNERVAASRTYPNTQAAYDELLHALELAGFSRQQEADFDSIHGVCPFGRRTSYELNENGDRAVDLWSTSCDKDDGNFGGDQRVVQRLFQAQIPDYREITRGVDV